MGEVVGAGLLSHAPTIMLPRETRYELNEGKEISLVPGLERLRIETLDDLAADTFVIFDTHWMSTVEHLLSAHERRSGRYTSDELPRGMSGIEYSYSGNPALARLAVDLAARHGTRAHATDDPYLPVHYPTINLLAYLHRGERVVSVSCAQTGEPPDFLAMGAALGEAIATLDVRVVLMASGGMSHRFWPLSALEKHEASDPVHIRTPEARAADERRIEWMKEGRHREIVTSMEEYEQFEPEGRFGHYLMMLGAIGGVRCHARGRLFSEYENATGTGQVHVWFARPESGWYE
jgi:3,4-dihydroxyphenylacetate 2,3-dioxygenase